MCSQCGCLAVPPLLAGVLLIEITTHTLSTKRGGWRLPHAPNECPQVQRGWGHPEGLLLLQVLQMCLELGGGGGLSADTASSLTARRLLST